MITGVLESKKIDSQVAQPQPNTFIGGVATSYPDAATLASKLNILTSDIANYTLVGNDIECIINTPYQIPIDGFLNTDLTYWQDIDGKITHLKRSCFQSCQNMRYFYSSANLTTENYVFRRNGTGDLGIKMIIEIPNADSIDAQTFYLTHSSIIDIRSALTLGATTGDDFVFIDAKGNPKIFVDPFLQTANSGGLEGDLVIAQNNGASIVFVQNQINPDPVSDLALTDVSVIRANTNFTIPNSSNNIDNYQVFDGNKFLGVLGNPGDKFAKLQPGKTQNIYVKTVDQYYNKSIASNTVIITTASANYPVEKILNYYDFEDNCIDWINRADGIPTNILYENWLSGKAIRNSGSGNVQLPANILPNNINAFSFSFLCKADDTSAQYRLFALNNNIGGPYILVRLNAGAVNEIEFYGYDGVARSVKTTAYNTTQNLHIGGSIVENGLLKLYVNGNFIGSIAIGTFTQVSNNGNYISAARNGTTSHKGLQDGLAIWDGELTATNFSNIASKQLAGEKLI